MVCALVLGKRLGYGSEPMPPHNLTYTAVGAAMLWVGWFGFNAGSALSASGLAASAFLATHFAAAAGGLAWAAMEWITRGKPSVLGMCSGRGGGVGLHYARRRLRHPMPALIMGVAVGIVCFLACTTSSRSWATTIRSTPLACTASAGPWALLTGVFATRATGAFADGKPLGLLEAAG